MRPFDTFPLILRSLSLAETLLKGKCANLDPVATNAYDSKHYFKAKNAPPQQTPEWMEKQLQSVQIDQTKAMLEIYFSHISIFLLIR